MGATVSAVLAVLRACKSATKVGLARSALDSCRVMTPKTGSVLLTCALRMAWALASEREAPDSTAEPSLICKPALTNLSWLATAALPLTKEVSVD